MVGWERDKSGRAVGGGDGAFHLFWELAFFGREERLILYGKGEEG